MTRRIRLHLTYENIMATLAAFLVLGGGTAFAAYVVSSNSQIGPGTVSGHRPPTGKHANVITGSVNSTDLATGAVTASKLGPSGPYRRVGASGQPAFQNGWANQGLGFSLAGFYKDPIGLVHLRGVIQGGTDGDPALTLPLGYRPAMTQFMPAASTSGVVDGFVRVLSTGEVIPSCDGGCSGLVGLDGLTFRAGG